jgi:phospholipase A1/A2
VIRSTATISAAMTVALGASAAQPSACRAIADATVRLNCYDRAIDAAESSTSVPPLNVPSGSALSSAAAVDRRPYDGSLAERWELGAAQSRGTFHVRPYKPVYVLPVVLADSVNRSPASSDSGNAVATRIPLNRVEAKFQLSLKTKLVQNVFGDNGDVWGAYTQSSRWQVYNSQLSRPFRETNYEPELMLVIRTDYSLFGWRGRLAGLSLNHQSNGREKPLSRSWNRVIAMVGADMEEWSVMLRPWWRVKESRAADDNQDIEDHIGRAELLLSRTWDAHLVSLQLRHSLRSGDRSRGSGEIEWAFPIASKLRGHVQLFSGYGESLIDYNFRQTRLGVGLSLVEWR